MIDEGQKMIRGIIFLRRAQNGVVVTGVEILQARIGIKPLADPPLGFGRGLRGGQPLGLLTKGLINRPFNHSPRAIRDRAD